MKRLAQLLLFVSFASYAHNNSEPAEITKYTSDCSTSCYGQNNNTQCCIPGPRGKRGPRGHRGHRGHTGPTGASGAELGEVLLTAAMLAGCSEGPVFPAFDLLSPYGGCFSIPVWNMYYFEGFVGNGGWGPFNVPIDLDNTKPVTAVVHILVTNSSAANGNANVEVDAAYLSNNEVGGIILPATGFDDTQSSGDFAVIPTDNRNIIQITVPVSLNASLLIPGDWAFISVTRIPAITNEFEDNIYLSTISIQYSRLSS